MVEVWVWLARISSGNVIIFSLSNAVQSHFTLAWSLEHVKRYLRRSNIKTLSRIHNEVIKPKCAYLNVAVNCI